MKKTNLVRRHGKYAVIYIIFFVGAFGHLIDDTRDIMIAMTPYTLLVMNTYVLWHAARASGPALLLWGAAVFTFTFILEIAGVCTGWLFGAYEYGDVLGTPLFGVPPIIGYNWVMVILGAAGMIGRDIQHPLSAAFATAFLAVLMDVIMEPVAIELGYWIWEGSGEIPLQNYIMWFITAFVLSYPLFRIPIRHTMPAVRHYIMALALFFLILQLMG